MSNPYAWSEENYNRNLQNAARVSAEERARARSELESRIRSRSAAASVVNNSDSSETSNIATMYSQYTQKVKEITTNENLSESDKIKRRIQLCKKTDEEILKNLKTIDPKVYMAIVDPYLGKTILFVSIEYEFSRVVEHILKSSGISLQYIEHRTMDAKPTTALGRILLGLWSWNKAKNGEKTPTIIDKTFIDFNWSKYMDMTVQILKYYILSGNYQKSAIFHKEINGLCKFYDDELKQAVLTNLRKQAGFKEFELDLENFCQPILETEATYSREPEVPTARPISLKKQKSRKMLQSRKRGVSKVPSVYPDAEVLEPGTYYYDDRGQVVVIPRTTTRQDGIRLQKRYGGKRRTKRR